MATTKARRHTHKYHKVTTGMGEVWACALPDCYHYMPSHMNELVPGKASICWSCGEAFIMTKLHMKTYQPVCFDCNPELQAVNEFPGMEEIGKKQY